MEFPLKDVEYWALHLTADKREISARGGQERFPQNRLRRTSFIRKPLYEIRLDGEQKI